MIIKKVRIENFKSISKIEIPFDRVGNSYTKIFIVIIELNIWLFLKKTIANINLMKKRE